MRTIADMTERFRQDEDGAAMVEYTVLIGLITAAVIAAIVIVATWMGTQWTALCTAIGVVC